MWQAVETLAWYIGAGLLIGLGVLAISALIVALLGMTYMVLLNDEERPDWGDGRFRR